MLAASLLLVFALGFAVPLTSPAAGQPDAPAPAEAEPQASSTESLMKQLGDLVDRAEQPPKARPEAQSEQPVSHSPFQRFESYLRNNANAWYVILTKLALAGFLGLMLALVYRASYTGKKKKYQPSMMQSQLLLCVGGALIWILVENYLVRAFGLAGMLGLIRYRTVVRDPKDTVIVFLSMAIGMACGLGQVTVGVVSTGFISLALAAMYAFGMGKKVEEKEPGDKLSPSPPTGE